MILLCYDGSPDSRSAVDRAGELMPGEPATVLTVWEPFIEVITRTGAGMAYWSEPLGAHQSPGRHDRGDDRLRRRRGRSEGDHPRDTWPDRPQVADAGKRVPRGGATR
jgi:hypothetical protein